MLVELVLLAITLNGGYCYGYEKDYYIDYDRIIGGESATIEKFPSTVYLEVDMWRTKEKRTKTYTCVATIIGPAWALTAAHCFVGEDEEFISMTARAGSTNRYIGGDFRRLDRFVIHKEFDMPTNENDIALIQVSPSFILNYRTIAAISLPQINQEVYPGYTGVIVGWGATSVTMATTNTLKKLDMRVINLQDCFYSPVTSAMIDRYFCAVSRINPTKQTPYWGDSGGPLYSGGEIIGVLMMGDKKSVFVNVFIKVSFYRAWIRNVTGI